MLLPHSDYNPHHLCLIPDPFLDKINLGRYRRTFGPLLRRQPLLSLQLPNCTPVLAPNPEVL